MLTLRKKIHCQSDKVNGKQQGVRLGLYLSQKD